jgi:hypothetical protein
MVRCRQKEMILESASKATVQRYPLRLSTLGLSALCEKHLIMEFSQPGYITFELFESTQKGSQLLSDKGSLNYWDPFEVDLNSARNISVRAERMNVSRAKLSIGVLKPSHTYDSPRSGPDAEFVLTDVLIDNLRMQTGPHPIL